jgi:hypothetical protein
VSLKVSLNKSRSGLRAEEKQEPRWARGSHAVQRDYIMDHVPAPVLDSSIAKLLDTPGEIHILDHCLAGFYDRRATRIPERSNLRRIY